MNPTANRPARPTEKAFAQDVPDPIPGMAFTFSNDKLEEDSRTLGQTWTSKAIIVQQPWHSAASFPAPLPSKLMIPSTVQQPSALGLAAQTQAAGAAGLAARHKTIDVNPTATRPARPTGMVFAGIFQAQFLECPSLSPMTN